MRNSKNVWTAGLPRWREGAIGRLSGEGRVFVVVVLDREPDRFVRLEMTPAQARSVAADLTTAANRIELPRAGEGVA
jgi:hypothetical protein